MVNVKLLVIGWAWAAPSGWMKMRKLVRHSTANVTQHMTGEDSRVMVSLAPSGSVQPFLSGVRCRAAGVTSTSVGSWRPSQSGVRRRTAGMTSTSVGSWWPSLSGDHCQAAAVMSGVNGLDLDLCLLCLTICLLCLIPMGTPTPYLREHFGRVWVKISWMPLSHVPQTWKHRILTFGLTCDIFRRKRSMFLKCLREIFQKKIKWKVSVRGIKNILALCIKDPMWNRRLYRNDTTPISDFTFIFNIIFVIMCFVLGPRLIPFPMPFNICRCASRHLAAAALAVVSLNFQPSLSSPSPFHNIFCHTIITSTLIATVFVVDVVVCVNKMPPRPPIYNLRFARWTDGTPPPPPVAGAEIAPAGKVICNRAELLTWRASFSSWSGLELNPAGLIGSWACEFVSAELIWDFG